jgi:hypothetical protein
MARHQNAQKDTKSQTLGFHAFKTSLKYAWHLFRKAENFPDKHLGEKHKHINLFPDELFIQKSLSNHFF